jgi:hypothetical protein
MNIPWDPLSVITEQDELILTTAKKRETQNILRSYVGFYDPFAELFQNAMDAVDALEREESNFQKRISVRIDLKSNSFSISDNGIGFSESQFKTFLCPNISFKDGQLTRGKKGVGATYLGYGFNFLQLATKAKGFSFVADFREGRKWLDDLNGIVERPKVQSSALIHASFDKFSRHCC